MSLTVGAEQCVPHFKNDDFLSKPTGFKVKMSKQYNDKYQPKFTTLIYTGSLTQLE